MLNLRIAYPYDLNDRLTEEYKIEDTHVLAGNKFTPLTKKTIEILLQQFTKNSFFPNEFFTKLKHHLSHNLSDVPNFCLVSLLAMNKYNLKIQQLSLKTI